MMRSGMMRRWRLSAPLLAGALLVAGAPARGQPAEPAANPPACPASGYSPPYYGVFGDNDGITRAYEIASPCTPKILRDAAEAIGMGRYSPLGLKNVTTIRFSAEGPLADAGKAPAPAKLDIGVSYVLPGMRMVIDRPGRHEVRVFAEDRAWDEKAPGQGPVASPALADRSVLVKLTPFGGLWSVIEAEGHVTVRPGPAGTTLVTGASPYDGIPVTVTLDAKALPIKVSLVDRGKRYEATFAGYSDEWESPYLVIFPKRITWSVDGRSMADLTVTKFHSNPYVVFPEIDELRKTASR